jgi:hypothetical protein
MSAQVFCKVSQEDVTMNRRIAWFGSAALLMVLGLSGCNNANFTTGPIPGKSDAPLVFVEALNPPGFSPLVGFDISYVDSNGNYYLSSTGYTTGVLEINTAQMTTFTEPTVLGSGKTSFVGALNPGYVTLDTAHAYEGGPNGVVAFTNPNAPTLVTGINGAEEVWAADGANFVDQAKITLVTNPANPAQTAYAAGYTATGEWKCNSAVQMYDTTNGEWHKAYTNGCFKADEIAADPVDQLVIVANPEEDPNLVTNPNSGPFPSQYVPCSIAIPNQNSATCPASGVPTAPFVSLISTVPSALADSMGNYYPVVKQIAFDGTNGTPDARWSPIFYLVNGFPGNSGGIEQSIYSAALKKIFVAVPDDASDPTNPPYGTPNGAIAVIDPVTYAVSKFTLTNCSPDGMALGPDGKEALLACNSTTGPQIINLQTGATIASFSQSVPKPTDAASLAIFANAGNMCDEAGYNPTTNVYVVACQFAYNNSLVSVIDAGTGLSGAAFLQNIPTNTLATSKNVAGAAHSVATDPVTGAILVPLPMGDPLCQSWTADTAAGAGVGCLGVWAPKGSWLQEGAY